MYMNIVEKPNDWRHFRGREQIFNPDHESIGYHEYQGLLLAK